MNYGNDPIGAVHAEKIAMLWRFLQALRHVRCDRDKHSRVSNKSHGGRLLEILCLSMHRLLDLGSYG